MSESQPSSSSLFSGLGLQSVINARGTVTRLGGAPMSSAVVAAMVEASGWTVSLEALHATACRQLAARCGTEAALVTCGAAAGLMLGAAAIMARYDLPRMERLPDTRGMAHEFLVARSQRNGYDHAVRAAGARLREVGMDEWTSGAGVRRVELSDYQTAIRSRTAGIFYVLDAPTRPPLADVVRMAHAQGLPVLVDAAAQWGSRAEVAAIVESGADLIVFSGGKALGGPQATGILCGTRSLVGSAFLQMIDLDEHLQHWSPPEEFIDRNQLSGLPRQGIGRMLKVSKEQIAGLLRAVEECTDERLASRTKQWMDWLEAIQSQLTDSNCRVQRVGTQVPRLEIQLVGNRAPERADRICQALMHETPPIYLGHGLLDSGRLTVDPACLDASVVTHLGQRLRDALATHG